MLQETSKKIDLDESKLLTPTYTRKYTETKLQTTCFYLKELCLRKENETYLLLNWNLSPWLFSA